MDAGLLRHYAAPYAYNYRGNLYRQWWRFLNSKDQEGNPVLSDLDIRRVASKYTTNWNPTGKIRIRSADRQAFVDNAIAAAPDDILAHKKDRRVALPDGSNCKYGCVFCWRRFPRKDNRDAHERSAYQEGLNPEAICNLLQETHGLTASPWTLESRIETWRLRQKVDLGPYFSEIKGAYEQGVIPSEIRKPIYNKCKAMISAKVLNEHMQQWGLHVRAPQAKPERIESRTGEVEIVQATAMRKEVVKLGVEEPDISLLKTLVDTGSSDLRKRKFEGQAVNAVAQIGEISAITSAGEKKAWSGGILSCTDPDDIEQDNDGAWAGWTGFPPRLQQLTPLLNGLRHGLISSAIKNGAGVYLKRRNEQNSSGTTF
ncbi:uncharacterized protein LY89DRAFT_663651 [Mollisia scopiformis]|uniref:C2H2-type domain-containing protein n=1 Tax=Mollisia scopiformis TaxID=149040 RepID=A0A194XU04_MOLSC|nr:uncharacterized protein LY89DRAFT_663651 [Mollisia scopiformis]KUJ23187.1 hypothetical protein LY89DRAFT_663651 [Mollisia scopiformis]